VKKEKGGVKKGGNRRAKKGNFREGEEKGKSDMPSVGEKGTSQGRGGKRGAEDVIKLAQGISKPRRRKEGGERGGI